MARSNKRTQNNGEKDFWDFHFEFVLIRRRYFRFSQE
jgi:hypothetical protein